MARPQHLCVICRADCLSSQWIVNDPRISNRHAKIYSIVFDQSQKDGIRPLVYAEDLSSNGTYWNGLFIGRGHGAVLLSDGDELRLSPKNILVFRTTVKGDDVEEVSTIQTKEMAVRSTTTGPIALLTCYRCFAADTIFRNGSLAREDRAKYTWP